MSSRKYAGLMPAFQSSVVSGGSRVPRRRNSRSCRIVSVIAISNGAGNGHFPELTAPNNYIRKGFVVRRSRLCATCGQQAANECDRQSCQRADLAHQPVQPLINGVGASRKRRDDASSTFRALLNDAGPTSKISNATMVRLMATRAAASKGAKP
jgi:hypothetical protein